MKLQLALDVINLKNAVTIVKELEDIIDIVEIGTPLIKKEGLQAVSAIKETFPQFVIVADMKIMDAGALEAQLAFEAGADIVTVLAAAENETILAAVREARKHDKQIMADMIAVKNIEKRIVEIEHLGIDYVCVHTAIDVQSPDIYPVINLQKAKNAVEKAKIAVAGGINFNSIEKIIVEKPDIVIVGGALTGKADRRKTGQKMKNILKMKN